MIAAQVAVKTSLVLIHVSGLQDFYRNFSNDPKVKIPWVRRDLSGPRVLTMEWIDGIRCTDPVGIRASGMDVAEFIRCGVVTGLRQLLEVSISPRSYPWTLPVLHPDPPPPLPRGPPCCHVIPPLRCAVDYIKFLLCLWAR